VSSPRRVRSSSTILPFVARTIATERGSRGFRCPACRSPLNLMQPDENEPTRLLAICDACTNWAFLVELEGDSETVLLVEVPDAETIRRTYLEVEAGPQDSGPGR
jgi:hypothetical protein